MNGRAEERHAWRAFLNAHARVISVLAQELEERTGLPLTWYDVLVQLHRVPERRLRPQALAQSLLISKSALTRRIDRMAAAGLVDRRGCLEDKRGAFVVLEPKGEEVLKAASAVHWDGIERHFLHHLEPDETACLRSALERVSKAAELESAGCGSSESGDFTASS